MISDLFPIVLETWVLQHLYPLFSTFRPSPTIYYWRTTDNKEVDFLVEWKDKLIAIEVKSTAEPKSGMAHGLRVLRKEYPELLSVGILMHTGDRLVTLGERLVAIPAYCLAL